MAVFVVRDRVEHDQWLHLQYEFPSSTGEWTQSVAGGVWLAPERFDERGRQLLIDAFGLKLLEEKLPREIIAACSPRKLAHYRRGIEREHCELRYMEIRNAIDTMLADDFPDRSVAYA